MKRFKYIKKKQLLLNLRPQLLKIKVVNFVSVGVLFFQLEWNVSVSECFGVLFRGLTVHIYIYIYIYSTNIIQIQDKLIINYAIQTQCQTNIISKFKIFLNSQD
jgi:hypothetical protein